MNKKIILVGGFVETIELCELCGYSIVGIIDNNLSGSICGYPVLGTDDTAFTLRNQYPNIPVLITPDQPKIRQDLAFLYASFGFSFVSLISPQAFISPSAQIGEGVLIQSFCNVSSNVKLGNFVKINTYSNIMHDTVVGDYVTIAPNAVILGAVSIGECAYIGANSTIIQTNVVENHAVVGAGAVVTKKVYPHSVVVGVPARPILPNTSIKKKENSL